MIDIHMLIANLLRSVVLPHSKFLHTPQLILFPDCSSNYPQWLLSSGQWYKDNRVCKHCKGTQVFTQQDKRYGQEKVKAALKQNKSPPGRVACNRCSTLLYQTSSKLVFSSKQPSYKISTKQTNLFSLKPFSTLWIMVSGEDVRCNSITKLGSRVIVSL